MTKLGDYYNALNSMYEQELVALAEAHAEDATLLAHRFHHSVKEVEQRPDIDEPFHESRRTRPPSPPTPVDEINSTIKFASHLCGGNTCTVEGAETLSFRYIDREIFPARSTGEERSPRRSLDLLLANSGDGTPVLAELKIGHDKPTYFAFIQVLMHAAELQSPSQRKRLEAHAPDHTFKWRAEGPFVDLYIISFNPPAAGAYRERSFDATKRISESLLQEPDFARYIRRIAYLEASAEGGAMRFEKRFAFGPDV